MIIWRSVVSSPTDLEFCLRVVGNKSAGTSAKKMSKNDSSEGNAFGAFILVPMVQGSVHNPRCGKFRYQAHVTPNNPSGALNIEVTGISAEKTSTADVECSIKKNGIVLEAFDSQSGSSVNKKPDGTFGWVKIMTAPAAIDGTFKERVQTAVVR